jgi:hypothetical protein
VLNAAKFGGGRPPGIERITQPRQHAAPTLEAGLTVDPEGVLEFPAESRPDDAAESNTQPLESAEIQSFRSR